MSTYLHNMIRNRFTAAFAVCFLLAAVIIPLSQQVLLSSGALCEITDENPEKAPDSEDSTEKLKCILSDYDEQLRFILLDPVEAVYHAALQSRLCEVFIPPPETQVA